MHVFTGIDEIKQGLGMVKMYKMQTAAAFHRESRRFAMAPADVPEPEWEKFTCWESRPRR